MRLTSIILLTTILAMASCTKRQEALPYVGEGTATDSTVLSVAVLPTLSCMPVHYAQRMGMFDSAGIHVHLYRYQAQMDVDTSVLRGHVQVAASDPFHAIRLQADSLWVRALMASDEPLSLMALKGKRVKHMQQMREKTVAVSRLSCTDYWCQHMISSAQLELSQLFRPQINDIPLRADMLRNGLIDAAMLPEPYATWAALEGHKCLKHTQGHDLCNTLWIAVRKQGTGNTVDARIHTFERIYRDAITRMTQGTESDTLRAILKAEYALPPLLADTICLPQVPMPRAVTAKEMETAAEWLRQQNRLPKEYSTQEFLAK